jgi:hypothetical protein
MRTGMFSTHSSFSKTIEANLTPSALAGLDASGDHGDEVASPPSVSSSPQVTKAQPAKGDEVKEANGAVKAS